MRGATHFVQTISSHDLTTASHPDKIFRQTPTKLQLNHSLPLTAFSNQSTAFCALQNGNVSESNGHNRRLERLADTPLRIAFLPRLVALRPLFANFCIRQTRKQARYRENLSENGQAQADDFEREFLVKLKMLDSPVRTFGGIV